MVWIRSFLLCCCFYIFSVPAFHADVFNFDEKITQKTLYPHLYYQITPQHVSVDAMVFEPERHHAFRVVSEPNQVFLPSNNTVWLFARLHYRGQSQIEFILDYNFPVADVVEFYSYDRQNHELRKLNRSGSHFPFNERQIQSRSYAVALQFKPDQEMDILIKVQDKALVQTEVSLNQTSFYYQQQLINKLFDGV